MSFRNIMKKLSLKRATKHEVKLISATPVHINNNSELSMYQANSAFDPNSKVLVPAPPKELPPPKPIIYQDEIKVNTKELPSPSRPCASLTTLKLENEVSNVPLHLPLCKEENVSIGLHPVRPAPEVPAVAKEKHVYTRSLTYPLKELKDNTSSTLKKTYSDKQKDINVYEEGIKIELVDQVEIKKIFPPPVKPKPIKSSTSNQVKNIDQQKPVAFIDAGDGLRSSDSESLGSEIFPYEIPSSLLEEDDGQSFGNYTRDNDQADRSKSESMSSSDERKKANKVRPLSMPSKKSVESGKYKKSKSSSFRRKPKSPPTSPAPPPISTTLNSISGGTQQDNFEVFMEMQDKDIVLDTPSSHLQTQKMKSELSIGGPRCITLRSYESKLDCDLTFKKGDVIKILFHVNNDWLYGQLNEINGFVFKEHVKIVEDLPKIPSDIHPEVDINKRNSIAHRCRILKELGEIVLTKEIEEHAIEAIWKEIEDLFQPSVNIEGRQTALEFMISLVRGQYKNLGLLRVQFFRLIENHDVNEDLCSRVTLLNCLTDNGKDISYYEQIGTFLLQFMSKALLSEKTNDFLLLLVNVIRFNSSFLDKETICSLVKKTCEFCHVANTELEVESCLSLLDVAVKYGGLPPEGLCPLIVTLCRTVNIKNFSQPSWKLMRSLIGTTFGHTVLNLMCCILEDNNNVTDLTLLRGAVFFIGMSIWGSQRVTSLRYQPLHVLSAFKISLQCANFVVAHEVGVSLLRLVNKFGPSQDLITWDIIMDILEILLKVIENLNGVDSQLLSGNVQSILSAIENLYIKNMMRGSVSRFFSIIESCSEDRPESSIITLLTYYEEQITPNRDDWLELFRRVLDNYLKNDKRTNIRVRVIEMITFVFSHYKHKYEDELIELFLKNYISAVVLEKDNEVRLVISQLLANLLQICSSVQYSALLQVVDELLSSLSNQRENLQDIEIIVGALIKAYKNKLFCPQSMFVVNIFTLLVKHVSLHYLINLPPLIGGNIRCKIFAAILSMRANSNHFVGVADGDTIAKYSAHTIFKSVNKEVAGCGEIWTICCDFQIAFDAILTCLKNELDWSVLEFVLKNLPHQLKNKSLFIYCQCNMNKLCAALSNLINDKTYLNKVQNCPATFGISELRNLIFPILSIVATYHSYLSKEQQFELLKCLEFGLNTVCAKTCVSCLTICTLEMQSVMIRVLPSILVKLSQISATVPMAVPVLQFLSTLKEISCLYANFVEEQYMSVFAMALPYTDLFKYSIYIVTLAHQVIADWFTRCRLAFRKGFVTLIAKALKSNIKTTSDKKDESYTRKCNLHEHMTEVCLDMMARYSFSNHLCQPQRSPVINYLLDKGDSQTWLLSNMLITITTSCGSQEKCLYCSSNKSSIKKIELPMQKKETCNNMQEVFLNIQSISTTPKVINSQVSVNKIPLESIPVVTASSCQQAYDGNQSSCEEEGTEVTPLVVKVAQELVQYQDQVYSPSEQLLFSRQVSKVCTNEKEDNDIDHHYYDDDDDNNDDDEFNVLNKNENKLENEVLQFYIDETQCIKNYIQNESILSPIFSSNYNKMPEIPFIKSDHEKKNPANAKHNRVGECKCVSEGWAEVYIRRPTGNVSWIMRIENNLNLPPCTLSELSLLASSLEGHSLKEKLSYQHSIRQRSSHSRSYSTGSIEIVKSKGSSFTDDVAWSLNQEDNLQELTERFAKAPLTKSMSNPKNVEQGLTAEDTKTFYSRFRAFSAVEPATNDNMNNVQCEERGPNNGISPYFIFLQLFYSTLSCFSDKTPLLLDHSEVIDRAVHILDRIPTFNTHKFGVLFVDRGQEKSEVEILSNEFGSTRYTDFISGLGELVQLHECISNGIFTGGMDCSGADGKFAYTWKDDTTQVIFHVATLMPNKERDSQCYSKKLHIGNNFVTIIYDESKFGYAFGTIKGQMSLAEVLIRPLDNSSNVVTIRIKDNCDAGVMQNHPFIISDQNLPVLVRQLAINTNILSKEHQDSFSYN